MSRTFINIDNYSAVTNNDIITWDNNITGFTATDVLSTSVITANTLYISGNVNVDEWHRPNMTNYTTPAPYAVTASSYLILAGNNTFPYNAFDGTGNMWRSAQGTTSGWVQIYLGGTGRTINAYSIRARSVSYPNAEPEDWTFEGSNDGTGWTILDTRGSQTSWSLTTPNYYYFTNTTSYLYYKLNISDNINYGTVNVIELNMYENNSNLERFLTVNTGGTIKYNIPIDNYISTSGDTINGNLTGTTFYGNLDWNYIQNEPTTLSGYNISSDALLYSDYNTHLNIVTPIMTSNTTPSPYVVGASTTYSASYPAWHAFNNDMISWNGWVSQSAVRTGWLKIDFGSTKLINTYQINPLSLTSTPKTWTFEGSNDDSTWVTIDRRTNINNWDLLGYNSYVFDQTIYIDRTPTMLSNNTPVPFVVAASSEYSASYAAWHIFDKNPAYNYAWITADAYTTGWLSLDFSEGQIIDAYNITPRPSYLTSAPNTWTFEGSFDNINWVILDTQTSQTGWGSSRSYFFKNSTPYRYYRINVSLNDGNPSYLAITELYLYQSQIQNIPYRYYRINISDSVAGSPYVAIREMRLFENKANPHNTTFNTLASTAHTNVVADISNFDLVTTGTGQYIAGIKEFTSGITTDLTANYYLYLRANTYTAGGAMNLKLNDYTLKYYNTNSTPGFLNPDFYIQSPLYNTTGITTKMRIASYGYVSFGSSNVYSWFTLTGSTSFPINTYTTNYTAGTYDYTILLDATNNDIELTLPTSVGIIGRNYNIKRMDNSAYNINIIPTSGQLIDGESSTTLATQYDVISIGSDNVGWFTKNFKYYAVDQNTIYNIQSGITGDTQLNFSISSDYRLTSIILQENSGYSAGYISIYTGSSYVVYRDYLQSGSTIQCSLIIEQFTEPKNLYISSDNWGTSSITIYTKIEKTT